MNHKYVTQHKPTRNKVIKEEPYTTSSIEYCGFCGWGVKRLEDGTAVHASSLGDRACDGEPPIVHARRAAQ